MLSSDKAFFQKMEYIHHNPLAGKWNLAESPEDYLWSSANYYAHGLDPFGIVHDYRLD
ncbi:MAG: hypothetical protein IPK03_09000 [Bacteroidetes bacterium]|nr:hypothetical protein [Bacteroidota bacterium]